MILCIRGLLMLAVAMIQDFRPRGQRVGDGCGRVLRICSLKSRLKSGILNIE